MVDDNLEAAIRQLKIEHDGEIEVAGPALVQRLTEISLIAAAQLRSEEMVASTSDRLEMHHADTVRDHLVSTSSTACVPSATARMSIATFY